MKEKREQDFEYRRVSDEIPMDLLRHVSFISTGNHLENLRERLKKKKKRRGRFSSSKLNSPSVQLNNQDGISHESLQIEHTKESEEHVLPNSLDTSSHSATTISVDMTLPADPDDSANNGVNHSQAHQEIPSANNTFNTRDGDAKRAENGRSTSSEEPLSHSSETPTAPTDTKEANPDSFFKLECADPLFGLWSGAFKVESPNEPQSPVPIEETFFLYGYAGTQVQDLPEELHTLPPEQYFSIPLLLDLKIKDPKLYTKSKLQSNGNEVEVETSNVDEEKLELKKFESPNLPFLDQYHGVNSEINVETPRAITGKVDETIPSTEMSSKFEVTPRPSFSEEAYSHMKFILGFGRNVYGRYSLVCYFDKEANTLRCEKRYVLTRQGNCRKTKSKTPSSSSFRYNDDQENGKRKRIPKTRYFPGATDDDFLFSNSNVSNDEEMKKPKIPKPLIFKISDDKNFREAFFDPNSGEIFEGGMKKSVDFTDDIVLDCIGLTRHGRGICLYADGTM